VAQAIDGDRRPNQHHLRMKTAPLAGAAAPVRFAFSGDNDGLIRPYPLASVFPAQNLDFFVNLGGVIYENASNLTTSGPHKTPLNAEQCVTER
jgi:phosphodiesterase/alkaline phosphatase D-like protein